MTAADRITCDACAAGRPGCPGWVHAGSLRLPCDGPPGDSPWAQRTRAWAAVKQHTPVFNGHDRRGRPGYPCGTCGRGRMHTHRSRSDRDQAVACPLCDGTTGLEPADVGIWSWKHGVPLDQLYPHTPEGA